VVLFVTSTGMLFMFTMVTFQMWLFPGTESLSHFADAVWNLEGPRLFATGTLLGSAAEAAAVGRLSSYETAAEGVPSSATAGAGLVRPSSPVSDGEEESPFAKNGGPQPAAGVAGRGGRKKSILALNDPQAVYDAMQPVANLVSVSAVMIVSFSIS